MTGRYPTRALMALSLVLAAACSPAAASAPPLELGDPPRGWLLVGRIQGDAATGPVTGRYAFSGRPLAIRVGCRGTATVFVIVGWTDVSALSGPVTFESAAFPCSTDPGRGFSNRIEVGAPAAGEADVRVFVVEGAGSSGTSYNVALEERRS